MKLTTLAAALISACGLSGCATYASYDNLGGGYYSTAPRPGYSVGIRYDTYVPVYRPVYRPPPPAYIVPRGPYHYPHPHW